MKDSQAPKEKDAVKDSGIAGKLRSFSAQKIKDSILGFKVDRKGLVIALLLIILLLFSFWIRTIPGRFNEMHELDSLYIYRMSQYALDHNFQLPERDMLRHYPFGSNPLEDEFAVQIYVPAIIYSIFQPVLDMHYYRFTVLFPALMGTLTVLVMFFIGRQLHSSYAGLFSAFFLSTIPAFFTRTAGGFFDKENTFGFFMLLFVLFFIIAYKKDSWKAGLVAGLFLGIATATSGTGRYLYIFSFLFAIVLLLINKYKPLINSYLPLVAVSTVVQLILPRDNLDSVFYYMFAAVAGMVILRYAIERFKLVDEKKLKYVSPAIFLAAIVGVLILSAISPYVYSLLQGLVSIAFVLDKDPIGYTVAEQQPGSIQAMIENSDARYAANIIPQLGFMAPYVTVWLFLSAGILLGCYKVIYRRDFIYLFLLFWMVSSMWGVFLFIRLLFLFGVPATLLAGLSLGWIFQKLLTVRLAVQKQNIKDALKYVSFAFVVFCAIVSVMNGANAFVYAYGIAPSACIPEPSLLINGERCLDIAKNGTITYASGQPWYQAMAYMRAVPMPKNILTWWDFGHLFNLRGQTPSVSDGGKGPRYETAIWYTAPVDKWNDFLPYLHKYNVTHIIQDYTLPGKYGAITAIATNGAGTVGILGLQQGSTFTQQGKNIREFTAGEFAFWVPMGADGNSIDGPVILASKQQDGRMSIGGYINDLCTSQGLAHLGDQQPSVGGCFAITQAGVFYVPQGHQNSIFASLQFMDGAGLPVKKVFDNLYVRIYEVQNATVSSQKSG